MIQFDNTRFEDIARQFFNIERWYGAAPLGNGHINDTYRIDFQENSLRKTYVLQRLNHHVFRQPQAVMANWQALAAHLFEKKYPFKIPHPIPTLDGKLLFESPNPPTTSSTSSTNSTNSTNFWRVFPFFENAVAPENAATPAMAFEAARAYGSFLKNLSDFPVGSLAETIPGFHDTDRRWEAFLEVLKNDPAGRLRTAEAEVEAMFSGQPIFLKISALKRSGLLPLRPTHNDTKAGNVLLDATTGQAVAVIDWDTVMPGTVLSDFGDMFRSFAPDRPEASRELENLRLRPAVIEAMCRGFLSETADFLTPAEREHLHTGALWIIGEQALRFLADYLAGDVYYKVSDAEENLWRARNQLALWQLVGSWNLENPPLQ